MADQKKRGRRFAVCVKNEGYEASLERNKIYVLLPDREAKQDGDLRAGDEADARRPYPRPQLFSNRSTAESRGSTSTGGLAAGRPARR